MASASASAPSAGQRWLSILGVAAVAACATTPRPIQTEVSEGPIVEVVTTEGMIHGFTAVDGRALASLGDGRWHGRATARALRREPGRGERSAP